MIQNNPYNIPESSKINIDKILDETDFYIKKLLQRMGEYYVSERDAKYSKKGILNDEYFLTVFYNNFYKPNFRTAFKNSSLPHYQILPQVYCEFSWLYENVVCEIIDSSYRQDLSSGVFDLSQEKKSPHKYLYGVKTKFKEMSNDYEANIETKHLGLLSSLKENNRALYYNIHRAIRSIAKEYQDNKINIARLLFQWASGTILNYFSFQYKLSNKIINKYLKTDQDWTEMIDIESLNTQRMNSSRIMLFTIMSKYILKKRELLEDVEYKDFISEMDHPELLILHKNTDGLKSSSTDKDSTYTPHHNTRPGLVEDLTEIIKKEIMGNSHYFHKDGKIKYTSVAKYAVGKDWFSDKHGPNHEGLHKHIKGIYKHINST